MINVGELEKMHIREGSGKYFGKVGINLLSLVGKIYAKVLLERVREVTEGLMVHEQKGFRAGRGCIDQIFFLKQIGEKARSC